MSKAKLAAFVGAGAVVLLTAGAVAARTFPLVAPSPDTPTAAEEAKAPVKDKAATTAAKPTEKPAFKSEARPQGRSKVPGDRQGRTGSRAW